MASGPTRTPIERIRVKNGYGLCTSALSASVVGCFDASSEKRKALNRALELRYQIDARFQMLQQHGKHPIRKALHMQKCYPETIQRLNDNAVAGHRQVPMLGNPPRTPSANQETNRRQSQSSQFHGYHSRRSNTEGLECNIEVPCSSQEQGITSPNPRIGEQDTVVCTGTGNTAAASSVSSYDTQGQRFSDKEYHFCRAKMEYNRVKGQKAEVDDILTGISPLDKNEPLFPARATHQQLLGMVNRPTNPDEPAPAIPRSLKWLGDNIGWEENRGLPTPSAGRYAKDGEVWPWPSSQFPRVDQPCRQLAASTS